MNLFQTIDNIKKIALVQPNVRTAIEGNVYSIMNNTPDLQYGVVVVTQGTHRSDEIFNYFNFNLFYIDRLVDDMESNRLQIQSIGIQVLNNIINTISDEYDIELSSDIQYNPFTQKFADETAGVYISVTLEVPKDSCVESYVEKPIVKIYNQKINMTFTENGEYKITYDKDIYTGIEAVNVIVEVDTTDAYYDGKADGIEEGIEQGKVIGREEGIEQGKVIGREEGKVIGREEAIESLPSLVVNENGTYEGAYKDIEVNVPQTAKISVKDSEIKLAYSNFTTIPDMFDFEGTTDMRYMFYNSKLTSLQTINTSSAVDMERMCSACYDLTEVAWFDTSSVTNMSSMFEGSEKLVTIPEFNTINVTDMSRMFYKCTKITTIPPLRADNVKHKSYGIFGISEMPLLTDFGGLINLRASMNGNYGFEKCPNLTYQSCINILNGLYDFTSNGETPSTNEGSLKVHQNFLNLVGEDINIAINKGWSITA